MYKVKFSGYASVFNTKDYFDDIILPLSFLKNTKENIRLLYEHDLCKEIGFITSTVQDEIGLYVEGIINTSEKKLIDLIFSNEYYGLSIGYIAKKYYYSGNIRIITELELIEVSLVLHPANKHSCIKYKELV